MFRDLSGFKAVFGALALCLVAGPVLATTTQGGKKPPANVHEAGVRENVIQVNTWNLFFRALETLHRARIKAREVNVSERLRDLYGEKGSIREVTYADARTGLVIAVLQYETKPPKVLQSIELFIDDAGGKVVRDYYARYLPDFRNAPVQTLINLHGRKDGMHGFRQFDASGQLIYEYCAGTINGEQVELRIDEDDLPAPAHIALSEPYLACFGDVPEEPGKYLDPLTDLPKAPEPLKSGLDDGTRDAATPAQVRRRIEALTRRLAADGRRADLYVERGQAHFLVHDFDAAIADYDRALKIDDGLDAAYFGRGMALGRRGDVADGIADLTTYIKRNPDSSRAFTKRGVRYIWLGDEARAEADLTRAVELDAGNAEAHDDLGVVKAKRGALDEARKHFETTIRLDPSYQKAYHNLAMVLHLTGSDADALAAVDQSLRLNAGNRDSMLLKAAILDALDRPKEAATIRESATFTPEGNWSERSALR